MKQENSNDFVNAFNKANSIFLTYYKSLFVIFFCVTLPFALLEQFIFERAASVEDKTAFGVLGIVSSFMEVQIVLILLGYIIQRQKIKNYLLGDHYRLHFKDLIIETFRAFGKIAVGFLFIFPGIRRAIQYYLIPYIVQFDPEYAAGKVDVLTEAEFLLKDRFGAFSGILILTQLVVIGIQFLGMQYNLFTTPGYWFLIYLLEMTVTAYVFLLFYNYYLNLKQMRH